MAGAEVISGGNHSWDKKEILEFMPHEPRLLRPANFPDGNPGSGLYIGTAKNGVKYAVLNLQGRVFMTPIDDPFRKADSELAKIPEDVASELQAPEKSNQTKLDWRLAWGRTYLKNFGLLEKSGGQSGTWKLSR